MKKPYGIMPPIATPFINDEIAYDKLAVNLSKWNKTGLSGYVVMGSNGESAFLTRDEKLKLVEAVKKNTPAEKLLIAGTGSDSIKETIALTNESAERGTDYALILTPSFYKSEMKPAAYIKYFYAVADKTKISIIIYNVPKFTGVDIEAETVAKLSMHPNIVGIKNSAENLRQTAELVSMCGKDFSVIAGTASVLYASLCVGSAGGILALANIAPNECVKIQNLVEEGKHEEALKLQQRLLPVNKAITAKYGVAGLKAALDMLGYFGGEPRSPLFILQDEDKIKLRQILEQAELL
ncbi:MAG: dihydrodipicolinate synthase/N-acetylneuraminate lyase [Ignavibacteria bacterium]|nr:MAG: dihydrodipicolinate synthase/N-acetylneuraminate lyase [Ignavibacteria bacterium]KAF0160689.1 MAG: dihydrodipicolinate synthase/N-acetylneuraminate lyase [Ignavibacteria bacterium]